MPDKHPLKVLIVDDNPGNLLSLKVILEPMGIMVVLASSGNEALALMLKHQFAMVLLDVEMPEMNGFEVAELMLQLEETKYIPIIFITAHMGDHLQLNKGYEAGAVDYISKPFNTETLKCKVRVFLRLFEQMEELVQQKKALKELIHEKHTMILQIEEQNEKKDRLLTQINQQNIDIRRLSKLKFWGACLLLMCSCAFLYTMIERNLELTDHTRELQQVNNYISNLNHAYKRFIPYDTLNLLGKKSIIDVDLGDQVLRDMVVMFIDTRGYSSIAENLTPQENLTLLNEIFAILQQPIEEYNGIVDKYLGDGLMALFPTGSADAVDASIKILNDLSKYSQEREQRGLAQIRIGIGIDGGQMILGTVGNKNRMEQTVVADAVNVASRLEGMTKMYGASLLISEYVYMHLNNPQHHFIRYMDTVLVKGRQKPVTVYQVIDGENSTNIALYKKTISQFSEGVHLFNDQKFQEALPLFKTVIATNSNDAAAISYIERCEKCIENPTRIKPSIIKTLETK